MAFDFDNIENSIYDYLDQLKILLSQDFWENILMDLSKNEAFVLMLIHRQEEVNMSAVAQYLSVPLNTATGIIARMEKKGIVQRIRSAQDKRVVTIIMTDKGKEQIDDMFTLCFGYFQKVMKRLTPEEILVAQKVFDKVMDVMKEPPSTQASKPKKVRKITID